MVELKNVAIIAGILLVVIGIVYITNDNSFSLTQTGDESVMDVIDTGIDCSTLSDCTKYPEAPDDVYCEDTCKFEIPRAVIVQ